MSRLWHKPAKIVVILSQDIPYCFIWQSKQHQILLIAQQWRFDVGWWRVRLWRDYYRVTTDTGLLVLIYHNLLSDTWFLERLYD